MDNDKFGDFTVMDGIVNQLMGSTIGSSVGEREFPVMDAPSDDELEDEDEIESKITEGFKDERTVKDKSTVIKMKDPSTIKDEESEENEPEESEEDGDKKDIDESTKGEEETDSKEETDSTDTSLVEAEPEIAAFVQEQLFEKLGWDIEEGDEFEKISDVVDYVEKLVEANSKPNFANEDIEKLNKFVAEGGDLRDYFVSQGELNLDTIDLESEYNQKSVIREYLKEEGLSDSQINKKIKRYDESGILDEEALEAKESLQNLRTKKADRLLKEQELLNQQQLQQQQKLYNDVSSTIDKIDNIRGIKLNKAEKNKLKDALLKVDSDGMTLYQKNYQDNMIMNFIESGFFTMKKDTLIKEMTEQAESKATKNLKKKLQQTTKKGKTTGPISDENDTIDKDHSVLRSLFGSLSKP